jgi:hypothetical protein
LGDKGEASLDSVALATTTPATNVTVPAGAKLSFATSFSGGTLTLSKGRSDTISDIDLVFSGYTSAGGWVLNGSFTLAANQNIVIPASQTVTLPAGKTLTNSGTITNNGTITLGAGASLVLTGAAGTSGAALAGTGKVVAAKTEITGVWQAVGTGTVTIVATDDDASTITGAATVVLTAGADGTITQNAGASNNLTIATGTTIDLKGTISGTAAVVGAIKLSESTTASEGGKLTLTDATSVIKVGDEADATTALAAAGGIFVDTAATTKITVSSFTNVQIFAGGTTTTKVNTIKGTAAAGTLQAFGGSGGTGAVEIKAGTALS